MSKTIAIAILALPVPPGSKPKPEGIYSAFTPRNDRIDSEIVLADADWNGKFDVENRYRAKSTLTMNLIQVRKAWDEWSSMPVVVSKPVWFKRGGLHHCIKVYLTNPINGNRWLHDRIVVQAGDFQGACRAADSQVYLDPENLQRRTYFNAGTVEHYENACAQLDLIADGSAPAILYENGKRKGPTLVDLRTERPLYREIELFCTTTGLGFSSQLYSRATWLNALKELEDLGLDLTTDNPARAHLIDRAIRSKAVSANQALWPRSYAVWKEVLKELEELGLDLSTDNPARVRLIDLIKGDLAHNKGCAEMALDPTRAPDVRSTMTLVNQETFLPANTECLEHVLQQGRGAVR